MAKKISKRVCEKEMGGPKKKSGSLEDFSIFNWILAVVIIDLHFKVRVPVILIKSYIFVTQLSIRPTSSSAGIGVVNYQSMFD